MLLDKYKQLLYLSFIGTIMCCNGHDFHPKTASREKLAYVFWCGLSGMRSYYWYDVPELPSDLIYNSIFVAVALETAREEEAETACVIQKLRRLKTDRHAKGSVNVTEKKIRTRRRTRRRTRTRTKTRRETVSERGNAASQETKTGTENVDVRNAIENVTGM